MQDPASEIKDVVRILLKGKPIGLRLRSGKQKIKYNSWCFIDNAFECRKYHRAPKGY